MSKTSDQSTAEMKWNNRYLFTSESVGEGHPGMNDTSNLFLSSLYVSASKKIQISRKPYVGGLRPVLQESVP